MSILQKAKNTSAYGKLGILGFPGSGKTFTSALIAKGICDLVKNRKVCFFDTETGSDFLIKKLDAEKIETFQVKSRAFADLCETIETCETEGVAVLIIDSITHVWRDLCDSYDKKLRRNGRLQFQDWSVIKGEWKRYTDLYVNSKLHIIVCGRAGYEYDYDFNEDGSKDLIKTATRMKVESEFAFEPSLVIEMERTSESKDDLKEVMGKSDFKAKTKKQSHQPRSGSKWIHRAYVLKDRSDTLNGKVFDYPTFEDFKPHFDYLNIGGEHMGVDVSRTSKDLFDINGKPDWKKTQERCSICIEEIDGILDRHLTAKGEDKIAKAAIRKHCLGTYSDTAIAQLPLDALEHGLSMVTDIFAAENPKDEIQKIVNTLTAKTKDTKKDDDNIPM